jgi:hypothetical protein
VSYAIQKQSYSAAVAAVASRQAGPAEEQITALEQGTEDAQFAVA